MLIVCFMALRTLADPKLREFLRVMDRRSNAIWSNEDASLLETAAASRPAPPSTAKLASEESDDDELYEDLPEACAPSGPAPKGKGSQDLRGVKGKYKKSRGSEKKGNKGQGEAEEEEVEGEEHMGGIRRKRRKKDEDDGAQAPAIGAKGKIGRKVESKPKEGE